jgi:hypothetical protein
MIDEYEVELSGQVVNLFSVFSLQECASADTRGWQKREVNDFILEELQEAVRVSIKIKPSKTGLHYYY